MNGASEDGRAGDDQGDEPPCGIRCPRCSVRLLVTLTRESAPGLKVRYVRCPVCRLGARTEEQIVRTFDPD